MILRYGELIERQIFAKIFYDNFAYHIVSNKFTKIAQYAALIVFTDPAPSPPVWLQGEQVELGW